MTSLTENGQCTEIINRLKIGESHKAIACWLRHLYSSFLQTAPWFALSNNPPPSQGLRHPPPLRPQLSLHWRPPLPMRLHPHLPPPSPRLLPSPSLIFCPLILYRNQRFRRYRTRLQYGTDAFGHAICQTAGLFAVLKPRVHRCFSSTRSMLWSILQHGLKERLQPWHLIIRKRRVPSEVDYSLKGGGINLVNM